MKFSKKNLLLLGLMTMLIFVIVGSTAYAAEESPLVGSKDQEYYMVTYSSGVPYWQRVFRGFEEAGELYNVEVNYSGTEKQEAGPAIDVLNQVIAKNPDGIAVSAMAEEAYEGTINKAIDEGIPVVTFDSDSPGSKRYSYIATGNKEAGSTAAHEMAKRLDEKGKVGVVTTVGPLNMKRRVEGFENTIKEEYPDIEVVQVADGGTSQSKATSAAEGILQRNSDLDGFFTTYGDMSEGAITASKGAGKDEIEIITFDADETTLNHIKEGTISASIAQGTFNQGYWALQFLYHINNDLVNPVKNWKENDVNPVPPKVDAGINVITEKNVDDFQSTFYEDE